MLCPTSIDMICLQGCDQPLIVRFADPKRPRAGEPRFDLAYKMSCLFQFLSTVSVFSLTSCLCSVLIDTNARINPNCGVKLCILHWLQVSFPLRIFLSSYSLFRNDLQIWGCDLLYIYSPAIFTFSFFWCLYLKILIPDLLLFASLANIMSYCLLCRRYLHETCRVRPLCMHYLLNVQVKLDISAFSFQLYGRLCILPITGSHI